MKKRCEQCGAVLDDDALFCAKCGAKVNNSDFSVTEELLWDDTEDESDYGTVPDFEEAQDDESIKNSVYTEPDVPKKNNGKKKATAIGVAAVMVVLIGGIATVKYVSTNKEANAKTTQVSKKETTKTTDNTKKEKKVNYKKIEDQSFNVELNGVGKVSFESYAPDATDNQYADAVFKIVKDGQASELPGMESNNVRTDRVFQSVEAVSFEDYNNDQKDDIIIINRYDSKGTTVDESRIYEQGNDGKFTLDEKLTSDINNNVTDKTVANINGYIQSGSTSNNENTGDWKQAYINWLAQQDTNSDYYIFDLNHDNIPEVAVCSIVTAYGTKLAVYTNGSIQETQVAGNMVLYTDGEEVIDVTGGSMDEYYDQLYAIQNGSWTLLAKGEYGAEDNSNVQFDENNQPIYIYKWDGGEVDHDDYYKLLNNYITRGNGINTIPLTYDEALAKINNF